MADKELVCIQIFLFFVDKFPTAFIKLQFLTKLSPLMSFDNFF